MVSVQSSSRLPDPETYFDNSLRFPAPHRVRIVRDLCQGLVERHAPAHNPHVDGQKVQLVHKGKWHFGPLAYSLSRFGLMFSVSI
jgi:hypothetical protein